MNNGFKIAHAADIQIRRAIRHDEFRQVFERLYEDLKKEKPNRIFLGGDIFHNKIDMSPNLIQLAAEFFMNLARIAPLDIIPGNHDLNLTQLSQGDSIKSIVSLLFNGNVVSQENKEQIDFDKKYQDSYGIYYFPESGFYDIGHDIVYGNYSCIDGEILSLTKKEKGKKYIALYHGMVYESMNDNGTLNKDASLLRVSAFNNFDIVMMGDIHEHQSFREDHSMAYSSSLIQNGFGESSKKGYILWDLDTNSFERKFIPNDYGFAKIRLSQGEIWEERLSSIQFSNNKKKTKIYIEWQDFEENYSVEKESQLIKYIKDNHGCESVTVDFKSIFKNNQINDDEIEADEIIDRDVNDLIRDWVKDNSENYDIDDKFIEELIDLSKKTDAELEIEPTDNKNSNVFWYVKSFEVCNLFSYGNTPIKFDFNQLAGLTGIFGQNYSGKTNFIKSLVWGLFQQILGGGDAKELVNIYTTSDKAYVNIYLNISGVDYRIFRSVRNYKGKDGETKTTYEVSYQVYEEDKKTGFMEWVDETNDKKTNDKRAVKELIVDSIGTASDFAKINLQSENGKDNYLNSDQSTKTELISKYLGLFDYQNRYDYIKKKFNEITKDQKRLGNVNDIQNEIKTTSEQVKQERANLEKLETEKKEKQKIIDSINNKIIELNSLLDKVEPLKETDEVVVESKLERERTSFKEEKEKYASIETWMSLNSRKELSETITENIYDLNSSLTSKKLELDDLNGKIKVGNEWISLNQKKTEVDTKHLEESLFSKKTSLNDLSNQLPTYRGEECPTCGTIKKQAEPELERVCLSEIDKTNQEISSIELEIKNAKEVVENNIKIEKATMKIQSIQNSLTSLNLNISEIKRKIDFLEKTKDIAEHNKTYDDNKVSLNKLRMSLEQRKKAIDEFVELKKNILLNKEKVNKNKSIELMIAQEKEGLLQERIFYQNIDRHTTEIFSELRISENSLKTLEDKIEMVRQQEKQYKLYSIYLQAVHKDGIPAEIIKRKLPIINSKMRSILNELVEYKIELYLDSKSNVRERYYYCDDLSDALSLESASGAQGFLANIAIREALHYVSKVPKSSMCIIDEGFGKLDATTAAGMEKPFQYLKNKYKNVFVVTHLDIIKDFMENIISISKSRDGIPEEYQSKYPNAWVTNVEMKQTK